MGQLCNTQTVNIVQYLMSFRLLFFILLWLAIPFFGLFFLGYYQGANETASLIIPTSRKSPLKSWISQHITGHRNALFDSLLYMTGTDKILNSSRQDFER